MTEPHGPCLLSSRYPLLILNSLRKNNKARIQPLLPFPCPSFFLGKTCYHRPSGLLRDCPLRSLCSCSESPVLTEYHLDTTTLASPAPSMTEADLIAAHVHLKSAAKGHLPYSSYEYFLRLLIRLQTFHRTVSFCGFSLNHISSELLVICFCSGRPWLNSSLS